MPKQSTKETTKQAENKTTNRTQNKKQETDSATIFSLNNKLNSPSITISNKTGTL